MTDINDGGPAFPVAGQEWDHDSKEYRPTIESGMTLRDWFAGKALAGWLASFPNDAFHPAQEKSLHSCESVAMWSYAMADAMLKHRSGEAD